MSVKDSFTTVTQTINVGTAFKLMHFKADGTAMAIGQTYDNSVGGILQVAGTISGTISKANQIKQTQTNTETGAWRYPTMFSGNTNDGYYSAYTNDGLRYYQQRGKDTTTGTWYSGTGITGTSTTAAIFSGSGVANAAVNDQYRNTDNNYTYICTVAGDPNTAKWKYTGNKTGQSIFQLGNNIASGSAGNQRSYLRMYGTGTYYHQISGNPTANRGLTLPDKAGTIALTSDIPGQKSCMTICHTGRPNITTTSDYQFVNIPLIALRGSIGSNLEYVSNANGIKVKKAMAALVSAQVATWNSVEAAEFTINITRNGHSDSLATGFSHLRAGGQIQHHVITPHLVNLNANDVICLYFDSSSTGQFCFLGDTKALYLTIQEL